MNMDGITPDLSDVIENRYQYNGKELEKDFGINLSDYGARFYDPSIGRWTSVDPLADKYPSISPFAYVANTPLMFIDPDGRKIEPVITPGGGTDGRDLMTFVVTGKIINFSGKAIDMNRAINDIKAKSESVFKGNDSSYDYAIEVNLNIAETMEDVSSDDHLVVLAKATNSKIPGSSNNYGGKVFALDADLFSGWYDLNIGNKGELVAAHELGHMFGLEHSFQAGNLMTQSYLGGSRVMGYQLNEIRRNALGLGKFKLNSGDPTNHLGFPNLGQAYEVFDLKNTAGRNSKPPQYRP